MQRILIAAVSALLVVGGLALASSGGSTDRSEPTTPGVSEQSVASADDRGGDRRSRDVGEPGEDLRGPCDEAEHANDPRCTGAQAPAERRDDRDARGDDERAERDADDQPGRDDDEPGERDDDDAGDDVRGPCDEAEHANDPRCTGAPATRRDDDRRDEEREDRSGPSENSGPGGGDHSGPGRGGDGHDDSDDDRSGSNSGPGGGDRDD